VTQVTVYLSEEEAKKLAEIANRLGLSKSDTLKLGLNLIEQLPKAYLALLILTWEVEELWGLAIELERDVVVLSKLWASDKLAKASEDLERLAAIEALKVLEDRLRRIDNISKRYAEDSERVRRMLLSQAALFQELLEKVEQNVGGEG